MHNNLPTQEFVIDLLKSKLPDYYYYHDAAHTLYVLDNVRLIGRHEGCGSGDIHLLSIAALWHDTGYTIKYLGHEEESCHLALKYLPEYGYSRENIEIICGMIMATRVPQMPATKLEQIIADADLEYLGAPHPEEKAEKLFKELQNVYPNVTPESWINTQISFLESHCYFTDYCKINTENKKQLYLQSLREKVF